MNENIFFETPITKTTIIEYNRFKIKNIVIELNASAKIVVLIFPSDESKDSVICKTIEMSPEDYALWGTDDTYIVNYVKDKLVTIL
jgi:hypothetical protein